MQTVQWECATAPGAVRYQIRKLSGMSAAPVVCTKACDDTWAGQGRAGQSEVLTPIQVPFGVVTVLLMCGGSDLMAVLGLLEILQAR